MAPTPLTALRDVAVTFGGGPLFENISLVVHRGERACLVGRNGCGKSTLLKVMAGLLEPDAGNLDRTPGSTARYLPQEPAFTPGATIADHVAGGLFHADEGHEVDRILDHFRLRGDAETNALSGGEARRADLARALVGAPDLLLLDEPTNHLDLPTILGLEEELSRFPGAIVMISHDRAFLGALTKRMFWMDRGVLRSRDAGFAAFETWAEEVAREEEAELNRLNVKLKEETRWLQRGVTARRKRNMGRLRALYDLRGQRQEMLASRERDMTFTASAGASGGKIVIEAKEVSKTYGERTILKPFSTRILRGDRVGIIGPNGAGKTTLLRILTGDLPPDTGEVKLGTNLTPTYFDQRRDSLNLDDTPWETLCPKGGDQVMVGERPRHVVSYLRDFLFDDAQARAKVRTLSGGERNRLLLAKVLARPTNLLVLDEPTNDLDMETLDLLLEVLSDYAGTLLLVSHDRDFIDRLVTNVMVFEGDGAVAEHAGGYSDYLARQPEKAPAAAAPAKKAATPAAAKPARPKKAAKLGYKDQRELESLPGTIAALETEIAALEQTLADADLFTKNPDRFQQATDRLTAAQGEREAAEERWLELEMLREALAEGG
ncbi:MAG: ABC-F family ATP-binding cassette domain-containing protein [Magnetospiraceae bacterium]